jgi:hypothetical protein
VWPRSRRARLTVRICREHVELWNDHAGCLERAKAHSGACRASESALRSALDAILSPDVSSDGQKALGVDFVIESAWLPVMPLEAGEALWSDAQMLALLSHRLGQVHGDGSTKAKQWSLRLDHRPGDSLAVGYALPPDVHAACVSAAAAGGWRVQSIQPSFSWGWDRFAAERRRVAGNRASCWIWQESDRSFVATLARGRVTLLHPSAPLPTSEAHLDRLMAMEAVRAGLDQHPALRMCAGWTPPSIPASASTHVFSVARSPEAAGNAHRSVAQAQVST